MEILLVAVGLLMLALLGALAGAVGREDPRSRKRWDARFDREAHELRRTDATGVLMCRSCGASGSERSGVCPRCGVTL